MNQALVSGQQFNHVFSQTHDFSAEGSYDLVASVNLAGDAFDANDSLALNVIHYPYIQDYPYEEGFENGAAGWQAEGIWELGQPTDFLLDRASQGSLAWGTDLDQDYPSYTEAKLISPVFDLSQLNYPVVSFDLAYVTEENWDGMVLAYRTDPSSRKFKVIEDAMGMANWYDGYADVFGYDAWTGTQADFVEAQASLEFLAGASQVQFAFIFSSDAFENEEGFVMDHFQIYEDLTIDNQITLSNNLIQENAGTNALVGTLTTPGAVGTLTYSLDVGEGSVNNTEFSIVGNALRAKSAFNFEIKNRYLIRVKGVDQAANVFTSIFYINVTDADDPLKGLALSKSSILENSPSGTTVGVLSADDEDQSENYVFSLVSGTGDTDNKSFGILNKELRTSAKFDFETKSSYSVRVQTKSSTSGAQAVAAFNISVEDGNDLPENLALSQNKIPDFEPSGFVVGAFSALDADKDDLQFSLAEGIGDNDNVRFVISGTDLITEEGADFSVQPKYRILVEANDGKGGFLVSPFEISVQEILGLMELAKMGVTLSPNPTSQYLNFKMANKTIANASIWISNMEGKELMKLDFNKESFVYKERFDLSGLSRGIYILTVQIGERCATGRVVKN